MSNKFSAVLFDFDGTLADTGEGIFKSVLYALSKIGEPPATQRQLAAFIGPPLVNSFMEQCGLSEEKSDLAVSFYRERYSKIGMFELRFYDGMLDLIRELRKAGIKTGVASAKPEIFIKQILAHFEIDELFDAAAGTQLSDRCVDKSDIIKRVVDGFGIDDTSKVLMVGDKSYDINGAKLSDVVSVGVLFGYGSREELTEANADYLVSDTDELRKIIFA